MYVKFKTTLKMFPKCVHFKTFYFKLTLYDNYFITLKQKIKFTGKCCLFIHYLLCKEV